MKQECALEHTQRVCLNRRTREHRRGLAQIANTMTHAATHYPKLVLHLVYMHAYSTIISVRQYKVAMSMFTLALKSIGLARRRPLDWDQLDKVKLTDPDRIPHQPSPPYGARF